MYEAYDIAEKYRCIVEIMTDSGIGQMMEPCDMPPFREIKKCDWGLDGTYKVRRPDFLGRNIPAESETYMQKVRAMRENEQRWVSTDVDDADYVFVAFGMCGRVMTGLIGELHEKGYKVGLIRPISAWPFPEKAFEELKEKNPNAKALSPWKRTAKVRWQRTLPSTQESTLWAMRPSTRWRMPAVCRKTMW